VTASEVVTAEIGRQAGRGLKWTISGQLAMKVGSFAMSLVLARLLAPADFGIYAIALAATAVLIHVNDVGLISATVQWRGRLEDMAPTASLMAAVFAAVIYGLFWFAAPAFASAAGDPAATTVVRLLALTIVIDGITAVRSAALMRTFQQNKLTIAIAAGLVVNAAVSITLALNGAGAFSFAWGQLAAALVTGVVVMAVARVPLRLGFDRPIAGRLIRYGVPLAAGLGVEAIALNIQFAVVGRIAGSVALGFFLLAYNVSSWAQTILGTAIRYVSVAGFSRLSEHDDEALSAGVQRSMPLLVLVVAPIVTLTSVLAVPLVALLYGERWGPAAPVLQLLAFLTLARMVSNLATDVLMGAGATRASLYINLGWAAALIPALWWATTADGIRGAAIAQSAVGFLVVIPLAAVALHRVGVAVKPIGQTLVRPLLSAAAAGLVALLVSRAVGPHPFLQLLLAGTAALLVYTPLAVPASMLRSWWSKLRRRPERARPGTPEAAPADGH
jgi:O-antigen/teichoic acid export membrane protein